jgi:hypothetical protein
MRGRISRPCKSNAGRVKKAAVRLARISTQQRPQHHYKGGNEDYADKVRKSLNNAKRDVSMLIGNLIGLRG